VISRAGYRAGEGEPVVLLHGFTASWSCWRPVLADLAARYDVYAPTLHGHAGGPAWPEGTPRNYDGIGDLVESLLDEQGIDTAHVVGNSMGGSLALELAKRGRARSVVALAPGGGWHHGDPEGPRIVKFFARQQKLAALSQSRAESIMARNTSRRLAFRDIMLRGDYMTPDLACEVLRDSVACEVVDLVFDAIKDGTAPARDLDKVTVPTLVAWPEQDRVLPRSRHAKRFRTEIPGVEYRVLGGTGHVPMFDRPQLVVDTIVEWVERHRDGAADAPAAAAAAST
jgi:pimeloyl-ACP methyl ester carboxylesterase